MCYDAGMETYAFSRPCGVGRSRWLAIAIAGLMLVAGAGPARALGPSFDCTKVVAPLAQIICASPALSRLDLQFAQAYYALCHPVGDAGRPGLLEEANVFEMIVLRACQVPASVPAWLSVPFSPPAFRQPTKASEGHGSPVSQDRRCKRRRAECSNI